ATDAMAYGHRFAQTGITFHSIIGITYKTPIRNRQSEALDAPLLPQAIRRRFGVENLRFALQNLILADDLPYSKRLPRLRESLAETTRRAAQSQRLEVVFNSTRDLLPRIGPPRRSTARWFHEIPFRGQNSPPERVY
ncbi:hypothetical protein Taro_040814, partial [Colocasia esculenta]|nr:hypothetical protein [Colocasia esculenta]